MTKKKNDKPQQCSGEEEEWERVLREHPVIGTNPFKFIYVGRRDYYYDINTKWNEDKFYDDLEPDEEEEEEPQRDWWTEAEEMLDTLNDFDKTLMKEHYIYGKSWSQIGRDRNQTRQNIYYHKERIVRALRKTYGVTADGDN